MRLVHVRRLAAVDMHGSAGGRTRRRIILIEFILGVLAGCTLGWWILATSQTTGWRVFGLWLIGIGLNYLPLALHAIALSPAGRLEAELEGVDVRRELRYYTAAQFWIFIPGLIAVLGAWQSIARRPA